MRPFLVLAIVYLLAKIVDCRAVENDTDENERDKRRHKFSVEDLLNTKFPRIITGDLDIDICKAGGFLGDIALPNIKYDTEWREQKLNKSYLEELKKYREEILKEGLQVEEEGLTEILQFKSEHDAKQMLHEHDETAREKSESVIINRDQYTTGDESDDGFSFGIRNDDTNPAVKNEGFEFRLEFSTQASKKRHSGQQVHRGAQLSRRTSISRSMTARQFNDDMPLEFSTSTTLTLEDNKYLSRTHTVGIKETFTTQPETSRQSLTNRRRRRHHRRRSLWTCN